MYICVISGNYSRSTAYGIGETVEEAYQDMVGSEDEADYPIPECQFFQGVRITAKASRVWDISPYKETA